MRKWLLFLCVAFVVSCSSIECPVDNMVVAVYEFCDEDGDPVVLEDTLTVSTKLRNGQDSVVLNKAVDVAGFSLPVSQDHPVDEFYFNFFGKDYDVTDTVWIEKEDIPHFESIECKATFFHQLKSVSFTEHILDSLAIKKAFVDYDYKTTHINIYLGGDR